MRTFLAGLAVSVLSFISVCEGAIAATFGPDNASIEFSVRFFVITKIRGTFEQFSGTYSFNQVDLEASAVSVTIDTASIRTDSEGRDRDLRSENFFDVENFPEMTFVSQDVLATSQLDGGIAGDLTLIGTTKAVQLSVAIEGEQFVATARIRRSDFGMTFGRPFVGDIVEIRIAVDLDSVASD